MQRRLTTLIVLTAFAALAASSCGGSAGSQATAAAPSTAGSDPATSAPRSPGTGTTVPGTATTVAATAPTTATTVTTVTTGASTTLPPVRPAATPGVVPPPAGPAPAPATVPPPTTVAHADQFSFEECGHDSVADPAAVAKSVGVPGPAVALISDSIGSQVRFGLVAGNQHNWIVWSRCGASVDDALAAGAAGTVARFRPAVVVVALGTNDAGYPKPQPGDAREFAAHASTLLAQIGPGPCVVWVDVAQVGDQVLQTEMNTINGAIGGMVVRGVRVARWTDVVGTDPGVLIDRVHLSHHGVERRIDLLDDAVDRCLKRSR